LDMRELIDNVQPNWIDFVAKNLNRFPIFLISNEWMETHVTGTGTGNKRDFTKEYKRCRQREKE